METPESAAPAEPTSIESVIETSIADLPDREPSEESGSAVEDSPSTSTTSTPPAAPAATPQAVIDDLAVALGLGDKPISDPGGRWHSQRVSYSKVKKLVSEREAAAKQAHEAALQEHTSKLTAYEQQLQAVAAVERLLDDPDQFVSAIAQHHPAWARYKPGAGTSTTPRPDTIPAGDLADGSYSPQGVQRLVDWAASQAEQRMAQRIAPIERERQSREMLQQAAQRVDQQLAEAAQWPMFAESQADILAAMQQDRRLTIDAAYRKVVFPKLSASRDAVRADVLAELQRKPHSTSVTSSTAAAAPDMVSDDVEDVIRRSIRKT